MKRIFLSGGISEWINVGDSAFEARKLQFKDEQRLLESLGWQVINPFDLGLRMDASHDRCMEETMKQLAFCDAIYFMNDWERSQGCRDEMMFALSTGKQVFFCNFEKYEICRCK